MELLKLVPFDFIQPSKLMLGLSPQDYVAVDENGVVLGRGRNKEAILATPGATGYYNIHEASSATATPSFDEKPFGSISAVQTVPGWPLMETVKVNRPDLVVVDEATNFTPEQIEKIVADGPRLLNKAADKASEQVAELYGGIAAKIDAKRDVKRDPLDHDGDGKKGGSVKGAKRKKAK